MAAELARTSVVPATADGITAAWKKIEQSVGL
jgi:hypothetical protein